MLRLKHFPSRWKVSDVIRLPKVLKDGTFPPNYRPINLLLVMSKIAEKIILARFKEATDDLGFLPNEQYGFRPLHSAEQKVLKFMKYAARGLCSNQTTAYFFLDVAKA